LELLGIEHEVTIENVVLSEENSKAFLLNLGIELAPKGVPSVDGDINTEGRNDKLLRDMIIPGEIVSELHSVVKIKKDNLKAIFTGKPIQEKDLVKKPDVKKDETIVVFVK